MREEVVPVNQGGAAVVWCTDSYLAEHQATISWTLTEIITFAPNLVVP